MEDLTGKQIGPYRVLSQIGRGGMVDVYKAYQPGLDRYVTLVILPRELTEFEGFSEGFRREAQIIAGLSHPHILPVYDYGAEEGYPYIVMRFLEHKNLAAILREGLLPLSQACRYAMDVASALGYAHERGILHRGVKSSKILIDSQGHCYLTDFGLADIFNKVQSPLGQSHTILGTPTYISPEQIQGQIVDQRSDIYSLGIVLYEMATGRVPFLADTPMAVAFKHIVDPLPMPRAINPALPESMEKIILKALAKNPADRYAAARVMAQALSDVLLTLPNDMSSKKQLSVFLCHSSSDKLMVRRLYNQLRKENWIDPWLDEENLLPGENWNDEIRKAVKASDCVLVCLSRGSISKEGYVQREIKLTLDVAEEKPEGTIFIIPLKLEECSVPSRLSAWQWVNYFDETAYPRLLLSLKKRAQNLGIQFE